MKKIFKIMVIVMLCLLLALIGIVIYASNKSFVPENYTTNVQTGGAIESKYISMGRYEVSYKETPVLQNFKKYEIYYPTKLESESKSYPVVVVANGSGLPASKYPALQKHLASWGFVVIATEETYSWNGFGAEMSLRHLNMLNNTENIGDEHNIFYKKIDLENVGITGHSQGGVGVFNAITANKHGETYKAGVALSPTKMDLADNLEWRYDVSGIRIPMLLLSSSDEKAYVDPSSLKDIYNYLPHDQLKVMATRNGAEHNDMLYFSDGYVTAWFMWHLQGDTEAEKAFIGEKAEILNNKLYQNQHINSK
ncbi:poly(ethylene terephthalate) hydrolase family protein [Paenibacillus xylanexedens]|uniref:poly(ethylene terephthalate) hydrolase family protein n=1 Tax=Paenibacillus xylanexedens TaxID=528191 RepID=UPI00119F5BCC|nr:lipase [Paenibacillus xylanexedens]